MKRRVVVTGIGFVTPAGSTIESFWSNICACKSFAAPISYFDHSAMPTHIACPVRDFDAAAYLDAKRASRYDPSILFCVGAAKKALQHSGLEIGKNILPSRIGIIEGTTATGLRNIFESHDNFFKKGHKGIILSRHVTCYNGSASSEAAIELGIKGQATSLATSCTSGNDAIAYGARSIITGQSEVMLSGATDASIVQVIFSLFIQAGVMSRANNLQHPMQPFDINRSGFVLGEGSCFLVLEELTHALGRGATIYAEWAGHGQSSEAFHATASTPEGLGIQESLREACLTANYNPSDIQYVCAHGSSTENNELVETTSYKAFFGTHASKLQISALKPVTGHMLAASSAVEAAACVLALYKQTIPPTAFLFNKMPGCDLDYVPNKPRPFPLNVVANVNMGFGGKVSATIFRKFVG
jgi:3-oxoacyl-[acyl-carrier-protein] synthase II